jgi:N-sulfoglucosamine sulfohydrolase
LFLFEDDGGFALGAYGDKVIPTPNLDALAARGLTFDNAYTSVSSCSPSRASLLSGIPTHQNGQFGLVNANFYSYDGVRSLPSALNDAGVATGIIGKYHVWAAGAVGNVYNFTWGNDPAGPGGCRAGASVPCAASDYNMVSRNITYMRESAVEFFNFAGADPFFLYVGFGDSHRCGGAVGAFCERYGLDDKNQSTIPDWRPFVVDGSAVQLPFWIQDTPIARADYANMYTAKNRMDQGVGLIMAALEASGRAAETLVIYSADNGAPFAAGKTNLYTPGMGEPLIISAPGGLAGARTSALASELDLMPTILDWLGVAFPPYRLNGFSVRLQGKSLLPLLNASVAPPPAPPTLLPHAQVRTAADLAATPPPHGARRGLAPTPTGNYSRVFASFQFHEQQEYFPMRVVVAADAAASFHYKLIYNIAGNYLPYPIAADLWASPSMQDLVQRTANDEPTHWYRNFSAYLAVRPRYELFDLLADPMELSNRAADPDFAGVLQVLKTDIQAFQNATNDDWVIKYAHE